MVIYKSTIVNEYLRELHPQAVIEVKRGRESNQNIFKDLRRLSKVRILHLGLRAFLLVVSERHRPPIFVNVDGNADPQPIVIDNADCIFKVRRVCKSAYGFESVDHSDYVCLVEAVPQVPQLIL